MKEIKEFLETSTAYTAKEIQEATGIESILDIKSSLEEGVALGIYKRKRNKGKFYYWKVKD